MVDALKKKDCIGVTFLSFKPAEKEVVSLRKVDKESKPRTYHVR